MASYKVAQDVEAEDKLLGPFSFRQFIYLVIAAMAGILAYGLFTLFAPLVIIPMPIVLFFVVLALPLRKDQPMEVYLAALVSYYVKPRKRLWQPDGIQSLIDITASHTVQQVLTKDISGNEAEQRLAYLATLADTQGWSIRNAQRPQQTSMVSDVYNDAQNTPDSWDENGSLARSFDTMIDKADQSRREQMVQRMHSPQPQPTQAAAPPNTSAQFQTPQPAAPTGTGAPTFDPYPNMHQHVVSPSGNPPAADPAAATTLQPQPDPITPQQQSTTPPEPTQSTESPETTSEKPLSPDIINLASNKDLTVETIAREAHRIEEKEKDNDEVVISLR